MKTEQKLMINNGLLEIKSLQAGQEMIRTVMASVIYDSNQQIVAFQQLHFTEDGLELLKPDPVILKIPDFDYIQIVTKFTSLTKDEWNRAIEKRLAECFQLKRERFIERTVCRNDSLTNAFKTKEMLAEEVVLLKKEIDQFFGTLGFE